MICHATGADVQDIARMLFDLNALHAQHHPERYHTKGRTEAICAVLQDELGQGAQILIYRTEGVARGYLMWKQHVSKATPLTRDRRMALLDHIYVEPIWRRRGLASRLIGRFLRDVDAQGYTGWQARVHCFNAASLALMRRHGAVPVAEVLEAQLS